MSESRLPTRLETSALMRACEAAGGFAMVLQKGEPDSGTIMIVIVDNQGLGTLYERMPQIDGSRKWTAVRHQSIDNKSEFNDYLERRSAQDRDMWIVELTIAEGERFVLNRN
ncbi:DUF1491 family protein [Novosphingobium cyanobacteriorum]|uniref:DUF1491 family protein n=1 Tax=Novosphingobium cyanobacteriorum TaxID=3024215 RepID=A0ABT6CGC3_9SPHN|nr:DUF1491 family protein [Novosphingobium cyanobacteriorum]MDF8332980.1 DUF1491 family protein [Novosphingobium cyanobacteriorum]